MSISMESVADKSHSEIMKALKDELTDDQYQVVSFLFFCIKEDTKEQISDALSILSEAKAAIGDVDTALSRLERGLD